MEFSEKLKQVRKVLNLSQKALAKELGVSFATVNRWENSQFEPNYRAIKKFEEFCKSRKIDV